MIDKVAKIIGALTIYALWILTLIFVLGLAVKGILWIWGNMF
ncbi:hypothetical protein ACU8IW_002003 [Listeria innocua]|nr:MULTISPECIES: hypothetical protein [Listeria]